MKILKISMNYTDIKFTNKSMKKTRVGTKGELTRLKLLNGAVYCLGRFGERQTSFQKIADHCHVSQPLVVHYFQKQENIVPAVFEYLLEISLKETESALSIAKPGKERLKAYLLISLEFIRKQPELGRIYLLFYYLSAYESRFLKLHSQVKAEATQRIARILTEGQSAGDFKILNDNEAALAAKTIHNSLTGLILNRLTEANSFSDQALIEHLYGDILKILTA